MSCCPAAPDIQVAEVTPDEPITGTEVQRLPGESEDCYMARKGNTTETGQVDDKIEPVSDKIQQNSVVTDGTATITLQFTTNGPTTIDTWIFSPSSFPGVTMTSSGLMSGTFDPSVQKTKLTVRVKAMSGATIVDDRTYNFSPSIYDATTAITLTHPLPGSIVTCKFGPRKPPTQGASSDHKGLDMAYSGGVTKNVFAAADGEVVLARPGSGYGNYVMIKHVNPGGVHLITTLYAHLNSIYVKLGQKVVGGQSIGKEGNSGIGTGAHLHFEVRMPNNTQVDPMPYLQGTVNVANGVTSANQPDGSGTTPASNTGNGITPSEVAARSSCEAFGTSYPAPASPPVPPPTITDPFEKAWFFTMTQEVNSLWETTVDRSPLSSGVAPGDPAVDAGLIDTSAHVQRVGFVNHPADPGGTTKFGVAQRYNPNVNILTMDYTTARATGYNVYWLSPTHSCAALASTKIAIMAFDMNYLMGPTASKTVMTAAGATGAETGAAELTALDNIHAARIAYLKTRPSNLFATYGRGWTRRAEACLTYAKSA